MIRNLIVEGLRTSFFATFDFQWSRQDSWVGSWPGTFARYCARSLGQEKRGRRSVPKPSKSMDTKPSAIQISAIQRETR